MTRHTKMTRGWRILLAVGVTGIVLAAFLGIQGVRALLAWRGIERVEFDLAEARSQLLGSAGSGPGTDELDTVLVIGSDERTEQQEQSVQETAYADALLFWIAPADGEDPMLVSLPRDLLVIDPCTGDETKLDRTLAACDNGISGPEHAALAVEGFTGIAVDHFALVGLDAFVDVIDAVGGVEICVKNALRASETVRLLPSGCSVADGATALRWIRSRETQELVDGEWRVIEGVSDQTRATRQQTLMLALLAKLKQMRSPTTLVSIAEGLENTVALDDELSMSDAISMAWDMRAVSASRIRRIVIPTEPATTPDGSFALRSTVPFMDLLDS